MKPRFTFHFLFILFFLSGVLISNSTFAQQKGRVKGIVTDKTNSEPLPFATVGIFSQKDSIIGGGITDEDGKFQVDLPFGQFYALVEFMGFEAVKLLSDEDEPVGLYLVFADLLSSFLASGKTSNEYRF
jgi:hypothetical protein